MLQDEQIRNLGLDTLRELETENGILASGRQEIYGCIFGRDSLLTALQMLKACHKQGNPYLLGFVRKILVNLAHLQGMSVVLESGEEPGKMIHEFRPSGHEHLTQHLDNPWYVYPDNVMRNFDSVDSTPLFLIACYRYWQISRDEEFFNELMPSVTAALTWILEYGDENGDGFVDYALDAERKYGGLVTQNWMDSEESVFHEDGSPVVLPIAPVEVQGYVYLALRLWSGYFEKHRPEFGELLLAYAIQLKQEFNEQYIILDHGNQSLAFALDGNGKPLVSARSSMGHCLWAAQTPLLDGIADCIIADQYIPAIKNRLLQEDLFVPLAGIRTLSSKSRMYSANSYHNGSIWPHDTAMVADGLENFGYVGESLMVRGALKSAISHFATPLELFVFENDTFRDYESEKGQKACRQQAWSAASLLNL